MSLVTNRQNHTRCLSQTESCVTSDRKPDYNVQKLVVNVSNNVYNPTNCTPPMCKRRFGVSLKIKKKKFCCKIRKY